jgi:hypothetical protein
MMMVVDTTSGALVAKLRIGRGNDAIAYDSKRERVFSSNGLDGTVSVHHEVAPDKYEALDTLTTAVSGWTMDVDPEPVTCSSPPPTLIRLPRPAAVRVRRPAPRG